MRRKGKFWLKKLNKKKVLGSVTSGARLAQLQRDIDKVGPLPPCSLRGHSHPHTHGELVSAHNNQRLANQSGQHAGIGGTQ